jgi:hypothetical protein
MEHSLPKSPLTSSSGTTTLTIPIVSDDRIIAEELFSAVRDRYSNDGNTMYAKLVFDYKTWNDVGSGLLSDPSRRSL